MKQLWPWPAAILSGALLTLCFPPWECAWLCWVALIPLIAAIWFGRSDPAEDALWREVRRGALLGYVAGLVYFWGVFWWLTTVTGLGWFLLPFYLALFPAAWGAFAGLLRRQTGDFTVSRRNLWLAFAVAAAWVAQEWVRGWLFTGFGWNGLGVSLYKTTLLIQLAEYTGVGGLSFLVVLTNVIGAVTVVRFIAEAQRRRIRPHWDFSLTMALIAADIAFGIRTVFNQPRQPETELKVAMVQPNIPEAEKLDPESEKTVFDRLTFLTNAALVLKPQLLVWPEAATVRSIYADERNFNFVHDFAARADFSFLLGTLDFDNDEGGHDYNVAVLLTNQGESIQTYRKMHLVPFGEYIPFRHSFPFFAWVMGALVPVDFTPGKEPVLLKTKNPALKLGSLICFEDTQADQTRRFVKGGAQLLVNVTNDGWFLKSAGSRQHLANAVFRTVENRRPLLRAANTGVTAIVDRLGRITNQLRGPGGTTFVEGTLNDVVAVPALNAPKTFFTRNGELFSVLCTIWAAAMIPVAAGRRRP